VKIIKKYDKELIKEIAKNCGSKNVKSTYSYLDVANFHSKGKFRCEIIDGCAFFAGLLGKKHFRLIETAVKEDSQGKGYGTAIIVRMKKLCKENNLEKITLRTSQEETAVNFFKKNGGIIVGTKGNDYEMEIKI
jgi:N-acetylglutamate synthase-like GNAT family acetyltransferase